MPEADSDEEGSALALLNRTLQASPEKMTLLALGPLTNLAERLTERATAPADIERIVIMGGAVDVPGNVGAAGAGIENEADEWNFYVDAGAADVVLRAGIPTTLVPLDATNHAPLTRAFLNSLQERRETTATNVVFELLQNNRDSMDSGAYYFWDPLAAALLTDPDLATYEERILRVVTEGGASHGSLRQAREGEPIRVAVAADNRRFETLFLQVLNMP